MMKLRSDRKAERSARLVLGLVAVVGVAACDRKSATSGSEGATTDTGGVVPAAAAAPAQSGAAAARESYDEPAFSLSLKAVGSYRAGEAGTVEVQIQAKEPYHVNPEYPIKLKLDPAAGVKFPSAVVGKEAAEIAGKQGKLKVQFTPERAGEHRIAGRLSFSVCNDERCLVERRDLALVVAAR